MTTNFQSGIKDGGRSLPPGEYGVKGIYLAAEKWEIDGQVHSIIPKYVVGAGESWNPPPDRDHLRAPVYNHCLQSMMDIQAGPNGKAGFLGSKERYREYFDRNPGAYWYTPGWIENHPAPGKERYENTYRQYVEKYGEDNAPYLMEMEQDWFSKYTTAAYVDLGVGDSTDYEAYTRDCAGWLKWRFDRLEGDAGLIRRFVNGAWEGDEFLVVEPGHAIQASNDDAVVCAVPEGRS